MPIDRKPEFFKGAQLKVAIIGCGYVGLPLALRFAEAGHKVTGFDTDPNKINMLNAGRSYIEHIPQTKIQQFVNSRHFGATDGFYSLEGRGRHPHLRADATGRAPRARPELCRANSYFDSAEPAEGPARGSGIYDVSRNHGRVGAANLRKEWLALPHCRRAGNDNVACDFWLAFSPEREDPGNKQYGLAQIPKVVGGVNPPSGRAAQSLYAQVVARVVPVSSTRAAEMAKLLENIFRCVNIALVNELKMLSLRMGIDIWEVIDAASTKPFGFMPFYPGPGLGGHCIPVDPYYLS